MKKVYIIRKAGNSILFAATLFVLIVGGNRSFAQCQAYFKHQVAIDSTGLLTIFCQDSSTSSSGAITSYTWSLNNATFSAGMQTSISVPCSTGVPMNVVKLTISTSSLCQSTFIDTIEGCNTGIYLQYFSQDTVQTFCTAPTNVGHYAYGNLLGYNIGDTVWIHVNYNDGTDTNLAVPAYQNYFFAWFFHTYQYPGLYYPQITVYSPDSLYTSSMVMNPPIEIADTCGTITGTVYLDNNFNCTFDSGDVVVPNRHVVLTGGAQVHHTYTDQYGIYSFNVPPPATFYGIQLDTTGNWYSGDFEMVCPQDGFIAVTSVPSSGNNMFVKCPSGYDLTAQLTGWRFVPGMEGMICVYPYDMRCTKPNGQIYLVLDTLLTAIPDTSLGYTVSGDTVSWNIASGGFYNHSYCVRVLTSTSATIGDSVCATVTIEPIAGDSVPTNNIKTHCWAVRGSWDPNEKSANPAGDGMNHAIRPGTELTYTIQFQNTGNYPAQNIFILDTLDANLDLYGLKILASSHSMVPDVLNGNVLRFSFNNINLPDSNSNEPLSHGYVIYSITHVDPIPNGTVINNTAAIYFDYNPPVITNTVSHTIDFFLSTSLMSRQGALQIFPNPAKEKIFIRFDDSRKAKLNIYDLAGRLVMMRELEHSGYVSLNLLQAGVYKVQLMQGEEVLTTSMAVVK